MGADYKYWAFISYSHEDEYWARWLHKHLEDFRLPRKYAANLPAESPCHHGIFGRYFRVFRDRDELKGATSLTASLRQALDASRYLVVICSPNSAKSFWVNEEVRYFKSLQPERTILCLLVPAKKPAGKDDPAESFPPLLLHTVDSAGIPGSDLPVPFAPDVRRHKDGRARAFCKLTAALLEVEFDYLWNRARRHFLQRLAASALLVSLLAMLLGLAWHQVKQIRVDSLLHEDVAELLKKPDVSGPRLDEALADARTETERERIRFRITELSRAASPAAKREKLSQKAVFYAHFSPDDRRILLPRADWSAQIYDISNGTQLAVLNHTNVVDWAMYSRDGNLIVTACNDGVARLWDANGLGSPPPRQVFIHSTVPGDILFPAVFDETGQRVVTVISTGNDTAAKIWDTATGRQIGPTFTKHTQNIQWATFDRQGNRVLSAGLDQTVRLWDSHTGVELQSWTNCITNYVAVKNLNEIDGRIRYAEFSPDEQRIAFGAWDGTIGLIDTRHPGIRYLVSAPLAKVLPGSPSWTRRVRFSADGRWLVAASADGAARVWNLTSNGPPLVLRHALMSKDVSYNEESARLKIRDAVFSPDGKIVATGGGDNMVKLWDTATGGLLCDDLRCDVFREEPNNAWVNAVEFSHDGRQLAAASQNGYAFLWDVTHPRTPVKINRLPPPDTDPQSKSPRLRAVLRDHGGYVALARFSPDDQAMVTMDAYSYNKPGVIRIWSTNGLLTTTIPGEDAVDAALDDGARRLCVRRANGSCELWNLANPRRPHHPILPATPNGSATVLVPGLPLQFLPDQNRIAIADPKHLRLVSLEPGNDVQVIPGVPLALSPDGHGFVARENPASTNFWLWEISTENVRRMFPLPLANATSGPVCAVFSADSRRLAGLTDDGRLRVWDTAGRYLFANDKEKGKQPLALAFNPAGTRLIAVFKAKAEVYTSAVWDASNGNPIHNRPTIKSPTNLELSNFQVQLAISPDGCWVVFNSNEPQVSVWDLESGVLVSTLFGHLANVTAATFASHHPWLVTGAEDGTARMWNLQAENH